MLAWSSSISASDLRDVQFRERVRASLASYTPTLEALASGPGASDQRRRSDVGLTTTKRAKSRLGAAEARVDNRVGLQRGHSINHYRAVADVYRTAAAQGRHDPSRAVAEEFRVNRGTARKWVARARELGLLPPTSPRRARAR
jgi:hypothetical protein